MHLNKYINYPENATVSYQSSRSRGDCSSKKAGVLKMAFNFLPHIQIS